MTQIEGGMLALIINGPFGESLGRAVTVDYFIGEHTSKTGITMQDCWSIVPARDPLVGADSETGEIRGYARGIIPAKWLMPIIDLEGYEDGELRELEA